MKEYYVKPLAEMLEHDNGCVLCQSDVNGLGGSTSDYGQDIENIFG